MKFKFKGLKQEILKGVFEISKDNGFEISDDGVLVDVVLSEERSLTIEKTNDGYKVFIPELGLILRAIMHILAGDTVYPYSEPVKFYMRGAMIDVSQCNSLLTVVESKKMIKYLAKMGYNNFMLYLEDCYELEGEPYFGYMRAKYSQSELKELDEYASTLGVEMMPCIQTLGHLTEALKRRYPYGDFKDNNSTLLVGDERTYALIDKMIKTAAETFKTDRIHIGMDEAWGLGCGKYLQKNGYVDPAVIMQEHLDRVSKILHKYNLKAIMWGDMFFRNRSKTHDYFDFNVELSEEDAKMVPCNITPIYWDYYHDYDVCVKLIKEFKKLSDDVVFAGCSRNVRTFGTHHARSIYTTNGALKACKEAGIKDVFTTMWGDDNRESSIYAVLPALTHFAEHFFCEDIPTEELCAKRFKVNVQADYWDFVKISKLDEVDGFNSPNLGSLSPSKVCMWQDILLGIADVNLNGFDFSQHYKNLAVDFKNISEISRDFDDMFDFYYNVANVLEIKANIGVNLTAAYKNNDTAYLKKAAEEILPDLYKRINDLRHSHRSYYMSIHKPIGWEVLDIRYGGSIMRIETAMKRLSDYLNGKVERLEELEEVRLRFNNEEKVPDVAFYLDLCSASRI